VISLRRRLALSLAVTLLTAVVTAAEDPLERAIENPDRNSTSIARDLFGREVCGSGRTYHLGALDRDKYQQVGEAGNFLLKLRRVEQPLGCASLAVRRFEGALG
jgi:hypothetical protein